MTSLQGIVRSFILPHIQKLDENSNYDASIFRYGLKKLISFMQKKVLFDVMKLKHNSTARSRAPAQAGAERQLCSPEATWMEPTTPYLTGSSGVCRSSEDHIRCTGCRESGLNQAGRGRPLHSGFVSRHCRAWAGDSEADLLLLLLTEGAHV